jgi:endonuclease YncB( thermonuclease family)
METPPKKGPAKTFQMWAYVASWYDGDTFYGIVDQGFGTYWGRLDKPLRCRAAKINAPEMSTPEGAPARDAAAALAPAGWYPCWTFGLDEFARPLVDLVLPSGAMQRPDAGGRARDHLRGEAKPLVTRLSRLYSPQLGLC